MAQNAPETYVRPGPATLKEVPIGQSMIYGPIDNTSEFTAQVAKMRKRYPEHANAKFTQRRFFAIDPDSERMIKLLEITRVA